MAIITAGDERKRKNKEIAFYCKEAGVGVTGY